jgi:hypothetical protein
MLSGVCAFEETCPFFLGYPACYTGFALFLSVLMSSGTALLVGATGRWPLVANCALSAAGCALAAKMTVAEVANPLAWHSPMGMPTCAYGFVFFAAVLLLTIFAWRSTRPMAPQVLQTLQAGGSS